MFSPTEHRAVDLDDPEALSRLSAVVREWEPTLDIVRPPSDALLYEPDGVLYAVCLAGELSLETDARTRVARLGDALVIPPAIGIEVSPRVDLLAVRHDGPPPDHFRERFLQVWGFDLVPALAVNVESGMIEVTPCSDVRFRVPYAMMDANAAGLLRLPNTQELRVVVGLSGDAGIALGSEENAIEFRVLPRQCLVVPPGVACRVTGPARLGVFTILNALAHEARRRGTGDGAALAPSPEYVPPGRRPAREP